MKLSILSTYKSLPESSRFAALEDGSVFSLACSSHSSGDGELDAVVSEQVGLASSQIILAV